MSDEKTVPATHGHAVAWVDRMEERVRDIETNLRARVAALEFAVVIESASERERAVSWALAYEKADASVAPSDGAMERLLASLRATVDMFGGTSKTIASFAAAPVSEAAKKRAFGAWMAPDEARRVVAGIERKGVTWRDLGVAVTPRDGAA